jgi:CRP-like cAMP-binding protein
LCTVPDQRRPARRDDNISAQSMTKIELVPSRNPAEQNWFLSRLPRQEYSQFSRHLEHIALEAGERLCEPGHTMSHVYFPEGAIISVVCCPSVDRALEVAVVAHEGFVGQPLLRVAPTTITRLVVQHDGHVKRARREAVRRLLERSSTARELAARSRQALLDEVMLCAACNFGHSPRERCARWFLMLHDRIEGDEFLVTQEFLGYMLGMTRQTVSGVASELQEHGSIEYRRGRVRITDRESLEGLACPCYGAIRARLRELLV